jgi:hypothetical protein
MATELLKRLSFEGVLTDAELNAVLVRRALFAEPVPVALAAVGLVVKTAIENIIERMGFFAATKLRPSAICRSLPKGLLRSLWALPIGENSETVVVALTDPTDVHAIKELAFHCKREIEPRVADMDQLRSILYEVDPPPEGRQITRPAFGQVSAARDAVFADAGDWSAPTEHSLQQVVGMVAPRVRSVTPSYGQPVVNLSSTNWSKTPANLVRMDGLAGSAIGAFVSPAVAGSTGPSTPNAELVPPAVRSATLRPPAMTSPTPARATPDNTIALRTRRITRTPPRPLAAAGPDAMQPLAELRAATDRDQVARICVHALLPLAERAAFFVVKKGVIQGWDGMSAHASVAGVSRESLRNLWIPQTTRSVFRLAIEAGGTFAGPLSESSADSILAAALGGRPTDVIVQLVEVRSRPVGFLYADPYGNSDELAQRIEALATAAAEALERWLLDTRAGR